MVINGKKIAGKILKDLKNKKKPGKKLAAVLVGENKASVSFLRQKERVAKVLGIEFEVLKFKSSVSFKELKQEIDKLNRNSQVGGIIIQLPLPKKFNLKRVLNLLSPKKDIDALTQASKILPPSAGAVEKIFKYIRFNPKNKKAVVVGRGFLIGQPVQAWLEPKVKKLIVTDKNKLDKKALVEADLIITGVGKENLIKGDFIKKSAVVIDFGYAFTRRESTRTGRGLTRKIVGDVDFEGCKSKAKYITPTPGGTGPILVVQLFENYYELSRL